MSFEFSFPFSSISIPISFHFWVPINWFVLQLSPYSIALMEKIMYSTDWIAGRGKQFSVKLDSSTENFFKDSNYWSRLLCYCARCLKTFGLISAAGVHSDPDLSGFGCLSRSLFQLSRADFFLLSLSLTIFWFLPPFLPLRSETTSSGKSVVSKSRRSHPESLETPSAITKQSTSVYSSKWNCMPVLFTQLLLAGDFQSKLLLVQ